MWSVDSRLMAATSAPSPEPNWRRDRVERQVLVAVEQLLAEFGSFSDIPVARIASAAGIARSTFYLYFPDKRRLLIRLGEQATQEMFAPAIDWWLSDHHDGQQGVIRAIRKLIAAYHLHHRILGAIIEVAAYQAEVAQFWQQCLKNFMHIASQRLQQLRGEGAIDASIDPESTAAALTFMVERVVPQQVRADDEATDARVAAALGRSIWLTVYGRP